MNAQGEEIEDHDDTEPPTHEASHEETGTSADTETEAKEEKQTEDTQNQIPRSHFTEHSSMPYTSILKKNQMIMTSNYSCAGTWMR
jgi:hypothetical protein